MKFIAIFTAVISASLLVLSLYGQFQGPSPATPTPGERFEAELTSSIRDMDALQAEAERRAGGALEDMSDREKMAIFYELVTDRLAHGDNRHSLETNWILWGLGKAVDSAGYIRDPNTLLRASTPALCSQQSYLLLSLAKQNNVTVRHVGLNGHVVMEAWYDGAWHMYDPDYEVVPVGENGDVLSVRDLEGDAALVMQAYGPKNGEGVAKLYTSAHDNTFSTIPQGAYFNWKAQVLLFVEMATEWLKYLVPLLALGMSLYFLLRRRGEIPH